MRAIRTTISGVRPRPPGMRHPSARATSTWLPAAVLALAALFVLAACGKDAGKGVKTNSVAVEAGRRYAQCMRDNGVPDFPDPDANGQFTGAGHEQRDAPKFLAAQQTCKPKLPGRGNH